MCFPLAKINMKNYARIIFVWFATIAFSHADVCPTTQARNQNRLAVAASFAIESNNVELLMALKKSGWDPSLILGKTLDEFDNRMTPLNHAVLFGAVKSLSWLLESCELDKESRDEYYRRPIDILMDVQSDPRSQELFEENEIPSMLKILQRENDPLETDAIKEISFSVFPKFGPSQYSITSVNDEPAQDIWNHFVLQLNQLSMEHPDKQDELPEHRLLIRWEKAGDTEYQFHISHDNHGWGGGVSGKIRHEFGYWIPRDLQFWDS
jgi:hypothetical protein